MVKIGHASIDENGKAKSGAAGDQTGKEVCTRNWYLNSKGWVLLRCKDEARRLKIAEAMEKACSNAQIGYDQNRRDTLFNNVKGNGFDPSKTTKKVETDCSALVRVCIAYAYGKDVAGNFNTTSEPAALVKTGLFTKHTTDKYCKSSDYLLRGDILCTPVKSHTVVVLTDGAKVARGKADYTLGMRYLREGCEGEDVRALQILLNANACPCGDTDGIFGKMTGDAVEAYQGKKSLTQDRVAGIDTMGHLLGVST